MTRFIYVYFILIIFCAFLLTCEKNLSDEGSGFISNPSGFEIHRGINISHWLSQTGPWAPRKTFFTKTDVKLIDSLGFDHIRLPIDEEILWHEDGTVNEESFQDVKNFLDWCAEYGLNVVVDLHILRSHHFNARNNEGKMTLWADTAAQNNFIRLWENLSDFLKDYPNDFLAYEFMNEPVAPDHEQWNQLIFRALKVIRQREPNRVIIFGSNRWQQPFTFPYLKIPENDKNIILSFHTYHPYFLTHHKAFWSPAKFYDGPVHYPGQCIADSDWNKYIDTTNIPLMSRLKEEKARGYYNKDTLLAIIQPAIDKAKEYGLQLYCNEFGCLPTIPEDMRLRYYQDVTDNFRENNIIWASWDYKGNFGIVSWDSENEKTSEPNMKLVKILTR